ncbi:hypothetical protein [Haloechinothrix sp. LS1_15]|uniref:hypothetical protein n=1 Tax=Haloechinothrix sp. LS1_15 TaxID=2652248 RepID=UPI0029487F5A|nr:hypothetical protein [Haloechinothrix sp. LS1_15]MDV6011012.1 hypothetical protein [Haloechinothrix sp. LS1_15]
MPRTRPTVAVTAAAAVALVLGGCSSEVSPGSGTTGDAPPTLAEIEPAEELEDNPVAPPNPTLHEYRLGDTHEDGISITVDGFELLDPERSEEYAEPGEPPAEWSVELTYTNNTDQPVHPAMISLYPRVDGDEEALSLVFEYEGGDENDAIPPGGTVTVPVAFTGSGQEYGVTVVQPDESSLARFDWSG